MRGGAQSKTTCGEEGENWRVEMKRTHNTEAEGKSDKSKTGIDEC